MMRPLLALLAVASLVMMAAPIVSAAPATGTSCAPDPCGTINVACRKAFGADCVRMEEDAALACMGPVCEAVNAVCWIALKTWCVG